MATDGKAWPLAGAAPSGLLLRDAALRQAQGGPEQGRRAASDTAFTAAGGAVTQRGDAWVHAGANAELKLEFEAAYRAKPNAIEVSGFIHDTTGRERAVTVRFALPVDALGGWWWPDILRRERIEDKVCNNLRFVGVGEKGKASCYPWGAISAAPGALCLAVPFDRFVVHRIEYDAKARAFYVDLDFGLSPLTKAFPSRADFTALIYTADPAWGFRAAAEKYYTLFAEGFKRRAEKEGLWMPFTDVAKVEDPEDFNFIFHEGNNNIPYDDAHGVYSFAYVSPHWAWLWMPDVKDKPTPEFVLRRLQENLHSDKKADLRLAELFVNSGALNAEGKYHFSIGQAHWAPSNFGPVGWYAMAPANADPDLEKLGKGQTTGGETMRSIERLLRDTEQRGQALDGIYFDGVDERPLDNYNREHFAFADAPLTFGADTKRPVLCGAFSAYKFLRRTADLMHSTGRLTMANGVPSQFPFSVGFLDAGGSELEPPIENDPVSVSWLAFARTLLCRKPLLLLYKPRLEERFDRDLSPYLVDYMNSCLLYAAEPSLFKIFSSTHFEFYYSFFERPDWYNKCRPIFIEYAPLVRTLALAGWQPVTCARADDEPRTNELVRGERVMVERFGAGDRTFLVAYNPQRDVSVSTNLDVDLRRLGWPQGAPVFAANLCDGAVVPITPAGDHVRVGVALAPRRAAVLAFSTSPSELAQLDLGEAVRYMGIAADRVAAKMEEKLPVDFESDSGRSGCPDGFHTYSHPPDSATYSSDTVVCHTPPRATKIVLHGEARGTQSVRLPARAGMKYVVSAWVKTDFPTPGNAYVYVQWSDKTNKTIRNEPAKENVQRTQEWMQLTQELTAPDQAAGLSLVMVGTHRGQGDVTVWFDDPRVAEIQPDGAQKEVLPLPRKAAPPQADRVLAELRRSSEPLKGLLAAAQKAAEAAPLCQEALRRAQETSQQAANLDAAYANVKAALDVCAARLGRAANILNGWRMTLTGDATVAMGDAPVFKVETAGGSLPVEDLTFEVAAPEKWKVDLIAPPPKGLAAGRGEGFTFRLSGGDDALGGRVVVKARGKVAGSRPVEIERGVSFEMVPACQTALVEQGQEEGGRVERLALRLKNARRERPLPVRISVTPAKGFACESDVFADRPAGPAGLNAGHAGLPIGKNTSERSVEVKAGEDLVVPIALKAGEQERTGWRETAVRVAWDNHEKVHRLPLLYVPPSANLLENGDMERPAGKDLAHWIKYEDGGYTADTEVRHSGARALHAFNNSHVKMAGATQRVILNQKAARPLVLRGWSLCRKPGGAEESKTIGMTELGGLGGERSADYSLYVDLHYGDGGALYGQAAMFDKSLISWQFAQKVIVVARPVKDATVYLLFRNQEGEAWFDDVSLAEADPDLALAPGAQVLTDSCYQGYTPKPLTDGVVDVKDVSWSEAAWASAESEGEHWVEIVLPQAMPVKTVILQWSLDGGVWASRKYSVQVFAEGAWRDVASVEDGEAAECSVHAFDPVTTNRVRVLQPKGGGPSGRPMIMWVREIEVY